MYQLSQPHPALAPHIESYWFVFAEAGEPVEISVDVFVDLRADLIFNLRAPYTRAVAGRRPRRISRSNLDAQRIHPIRIEQRGDVRICGVRFRIAGLAPFVAAPVDRFSNRVVPIATVFGKTIVALENELRAAEADRQAQTELLDAFFLRRLELGKPNTLVHQLKDQIDAEGGLERVAELCARAGISRRQLDRLFRSQLGFNPKTFARVVRFQRALARLRSDPGCTLADLAAECGYYDQPHFVREFKALAGSPPKTRVGYFPPGAPTDFSPNLVRFVQDDRSKGEEKRRTKERR
jgi:AraC-like DNA-binding protein